MVASAQDRCHKVWIGRRSLIPVNPNASLKGDDDGGMYGTGLAPDPPTIRPSRRHQSNQIGPNNPPTYWSDVLELPEKPNSPRALKP